MAGVAVAAGDGVRRIRELAAAAVVGDLARLSFQLPSGLAVGGIDHPRQFALDDLVGFRRLGTLLG